MSLLTPPIMTSLSFSFLFFLFFVPSNPFPAQTPRLTIMEKKKGPVMVDMEWFVISFFFPSPSSLTKFSHSSLIKFIMARTGDPRSQITRRARLLPSNSKKRALLLPPDPARRALLLPPSQTKNNSFCFVGLSRD